MVPVAFLRNKNLRLILKKLGPIKALKTVTALWRYKVWPIHLPDMFCS